MQSLTFTVLMLCLAVSGCGETPACVAHVECGEAQMCVAGACTEADAPGTLDMAADTTVTDMQPPAPMPDRAMPAPDMMLVEPDMAPMLDMAVSPVDQGPLDQGPLDQGEFVPSRAGFTATVMPVFSALCASCHSRPADPLNNEFDTPMGDPQGAYEEALLYIDVALPRNSPLLVLALQGSHQGVWARDDADYMRVLDWISGD